MNENGLIRILFNRDNYQRFSQHLKEFTMLPETWEIIKDVGDYYDNYPNDDTIDVEKFIVWSRLQHPTKKGNQRAAYEAQIEIASKQPEDFSIIDRLHELTTAVEVKDLCDEVIYNGGTKKMERIASLVDTWRDMHERGGYDDPLAQCSLDDVFESLSRTGGLSWRLPELNLAVGPICKGDFVLVGKRPEVGGTTFLTSEMTHMLAQTPENGRAIIFNNEELAGRVKGRAMQGALGITDKQLFADRAKSEEAWAKFLGTRTFDFVHKTDMTTGWIESILKRHKYDVIGINVLWKVRPWGRNLEDYQSYQRVAQFAREIACNYAPVIAIWQADKSAEGVEWMDQSQLFGSKTGVQGEADVQIMIGASSDPGRMHERYISVVKNKIPGSPSTKPAYRHGKFVVDIDTERGLFKGRMK